MVNHPNRSGHSVRHEVFDLPTFMLRRDQSETLAQAIDRQFGALCKAWEGHQDDIGNVAGWKLRSVCLDSPAREATRNGKTFASLIIVAGGQPLAHRPADPKPRTTRIDIEATIADVPERFVFEVRA